MGTLFQVSGMQNDRDFMSCGIRNSCEICHLGILKRLSQKQFEQTHFMAVSFQFFVISFHSKNLEYIGVTFFNGMYRYYLSKLVHKKIQELDLGVELLCKKRCLVTPPGHYCLKFQFWLLLESYVSRILPRLVAIRRNVSY